MTETSAVSSVRASASRSGLTTPRSSTPTKATDRSFPSSAFSVRRTASCSIAPATRRRRPAPAAASATPRMARLFDSEPPDVNTISVGSAPIKPATADRASSRAVLASCPYAWTLDGLPKTSRRARAIASATGGATGVVALWSR